MNIAKYYASIGFQIDTRDIQKVDRALKLVEGKLKGLQKRLATTLTFDISKFDVNQKRLNRVLGDALDAASNKVTFEVSNFSINKRNLQAALLRASTGTGASFSVGGGQLSPAEWNRRTLMSSQLRRQEAEARQRERLQLAAMQPNTHASVARAAATGAAFGGIGLRRLGAAGLALAGGGYGLSALNKRNQEVVSAQLQSQAVVQQAGGTAEQGQASFQYLRSEANRIGFNYLDASADYNKLISGLTGSGFSVKDSQKVFSGFAELARVNKLDKTTQNRLFRALSQVAGKGKLQSEELTGQIAEALPGGTALFARAYQAQLAAQGKGSGLTGQAAIEKLRADMQKGLVTSEILRYAGIDASTQANKGGALALASTASQAEQQRYQNTVSDLAVVASNAGVEEGFARIFRTLNAGLSESNDLVEMLARGFNDATKWADDLILFPQSFIRALEGRDSVVADWLGADATKQLQEDWKSIKSSLESISTIGAPSWLPTLESTSRDIATQFQIISKLASGDFSGLGDALTNFVTERYQNYGNAIASGPNLALRAVGNFFDTSVPQINFGGGPDSFAPKSVMDLYGLGNNPSSGDSTRYGLFDNQQVGPKESNAFGLDPINLDFNLPANEFDKSFTGRDARDYEPSLYKPKGSLDSAENLSDVLPNDGFDKSFTGKDYRTFEPSLYNPKASTDRNSNVFNDTLPTDEFDRSLASTLTDARQISTTNQFNIQLTVDAATLGGIDIEVQAQQLAQAFATNLEQVSVFFPNKE